MTRCLGCDPSVSAASGLGRLIDMKGASEGEEMDEIRRDQVT